MRNRIQKTISYILGSPALLVLVIGTGLFLILLARGLDIGPLQTDVIIIRAWFREVGVGGFSQRYFDVNQRHLLAGPFQALVYSFFGEQDLPYHVIFQMSRVFEGVFMAGLIYQLTRRRALAVCAGLALLLTMIRVRELYQGINWFIEPTLALLLASSYTYLLSLRLASRRWLWYVLSLVLFALSILIYESGLPWIGVNLFLGWVARREGSARRRAWLALRDALPGILGAGFIAFLVLVVFKPWSSLAPDSSAGSLGRILSQIGGAIAFPALYVARLREALQEGYTGMLILFALLAAGVGVIGVIISARARNAVPHPSVPSPFTERGGQNDPISLHDSPSLKSGRGIGGEVSAGASGDYLVVFTLALVMLLAGVLVGTSSSHINMEYLDRITFGRAAGISLFYVTVIFALSSLLPAARRDVAAVGLSALLLLGPGFAVMWNYQDTARYTRAEIERIAAAVIEVRKVIYLPADLVILTDRDWLPAKFPDASDVIVHEVQDILYRSNEPASIDFLKVGGFEDNYATFPGSCRTVNGERSTGICLDETALRSSRWAVGETYPYDDVVMLHWDAHAGKLDILRSIALADLQGYNITTAGPTVLQTNPTRVAIPIP